MTASLYQGSGDYTSVVGQNPTGQLPKPIAALKQGSEGPTMSDMQFELENERKQHQQAYDYAHGHAQDNIPLGTPSF